MSMKNENYGKGCGLRLIYTCSPAETEGVTQIGRFRYQLGKLLGEQVKEELAGKLDYIVPIPNSGLYYAMGVAEVLGVPYLQAVVKRNSQRTLKESDLDKRTTYMLGNMMLLPGLLEGKRVALVDEAVFTGTTLKVLCQMLLRSGVAEIYVLIPTSVCAAACPYGDRPPAELLAGRLSLEDMRQYFGIAGIRFLTYDTLRSYTSRFQPVCLECFRPSKPAPQR